MTTDEQMTEFHSAIFEAVKVLGQAVVMTEGARDIVEAGLSEAREKMARTGQMNASKYLEALREEILRNRHE